MRGPTLSHKPTLKEQNVAVLPNEYEGCGVALQVVRVSFRLTVGQGIESFP